MKRPAQWNEPPAKYPRSHLEPTGPSPPPYSDDDLDDDWDACDPVPEVDELWEPDELDEEEAEPEYGDFWLDQNEHRDEDF